MRQNKRRAFIIISVLLMLAMMPFALAEAPPPVEGDATNGNALQVTDPSAVNGSTDPNANGVPGTSEGSNTDPATPQLPTPEGESTEPKVEGEDAAAKEGEGAAAAAAPAALMMAAPAAAAVSAEAAANYIYATVQTGVNGLSATLYSQASVSSSGLGNYVNGTSVRVYEKASTFSLVGVNERVGYMLTQVLDFGSGSGSQGSSTSYAYALLPYNATYLPMYEQATTSSNVLVQLKAGDQVEVLRYGSSFTQVRASNKTGYVQAQYLTSTPGTNSPSTGSIAYVVSPPFSDYLSLYEYDSTGAKVLAVYPADTQVTVLSKSGSFSYVDINGKRGYMLSQYLSATKGSGSTSNPDDAYYAYVQAPSGSSWLALHAEPSTTSSQLTQYTAGTRVKVLYQLNSTWSYVEVGSLKGYMLSQYLTSNNPGGSSSAITQATVVVPAGAVGVHLYSAESTGSTPLATYSDGTRVSVLQANSEWCHVQINSVLGYMQTSCLRLDSNDYSGSMYYMYVSVPSGSMNIPMYAQASTNSRQLGTLSNAAKVRLLNQTANWSLVEISNTQGYVLTQYLTSNASGNTSYATSATVNNSNPRDKLNLRASATTASTSLGRYSNGTAVTILEYGNEWCHVQVSGKTGYMMTRYLALKSGGSTPGGTNPGGTYPGGTYPGGTNPGTNPGTITGYAVVANKNASSLLHLRERDSTASRSLGMYPNGTQVSLLQQGSTWCYVQVAGKTGYMYTANLSISRQPSVTQPPSSTTAYVNAKALLMYTEPDIYSRGIRAYSLGTVVKILTQGSEWCYVEIDSQRGYMLTQYLSR